MTERSASQGFVETTPQVLFVIAWRHGLANSGVAFLCAPGRDFAGMEATNRGIQMAELCARTLGREPLCESCSHTYFWPLTGT